MAEEIPSLEVLSPVARFLVRRRTLFSWLLPLLLVAVADPWQYLMPLGAALVALGVGLRIWAAGYLVKGKRLASSGPFAHVRNPLYLGSLVILLGYCTLSGRWLSYPLFLMLFAAFYLPTIRWEEDSLRAKFGDDYEDYARRVPRLFPRLTPAYASRESFSWGQVRRNRELSSLALGAIMIVLFGIRLVV